MPRAQGGEGEAAVACACGHAKVDDLDLKPTNRDAAARATPSSYVAVAWPTFLMWAAPAVAPS